MSTQHGLIRIFWPSGDYKSDVPGILVGWRNSVSDIFVAAILEDAQECLVHDALRMGSLFRNSPHPVTDILKKCGPFKLEVLGTTNHIDAPTSSPTGRITAYKSPNSRLPEVRVEGGEALSAQIILFERPDPAKMQYVSLEPISLALTNASRSVSSDFGPAEEEQEKAKTQRRKKAHLVQKLKLHTVKTNIPCATELALPTIINQINCCCEINTLMQSNIGLVRPRSKRAVSVSERVVESATDLWYYVRLVAWYIILEWIYPLATKLFIFGLISHRVAGELIVLLVNWRITAQGAALRDLVATAQQVDLRLQQFCYWPMQYSMLRERKDSWESIAGNHPEYIRFYNSLWLVANDVIIGIAIGTYIIENVDSVTAQADYMLRAWSLEGLEGMISWLMDYPAGLKLNNELAEFLGDLFLSVINCWAGCVGTLRPAFPHIIRFLGFASFAGATMSLSLISDLVSLFTLHIHCFYIASARIYSWQLTIITSLFHLFRGKKRNVLRNRIDSCDYELDQLLLGTILFTLLFFLLPTVAVFYLTFAFARMGIIVLKATMDTLLACLNHFPIFALMLRFKDPSRLPGGIRFELHEIPSNPLGQDKDSFKASYIELKRVPLSLRAMFNEYFQLGDRIRKHYLSPGVLLCLATGGFVPPLHRKNLYGLQYSMLPSRRVGIIELWAKLNGPGVSTHGKSTSNGHTIH